MELYTRLIAALAIGITFGMITFTFPETTRAKVSKKSQALKRRKLIRPAQKTIPSIRDTAAQSPAHQARLAQIKQESARAAATLQNALQQTNQAMQQSLQAGDTQGAVALHNDVKKTLAIISSRIKKINRQKPHYVRKLKKNQ